ncbi:MAG: hypothetical protein JXR04_02955 [Bermanella sp.]
MNYYQDSIEKKIKSKASLSLFVIVLAFFLYFDPYFFQPINSMIIFTILSLPLHNSRSLGYLKSFLFSKFIWLYFSIFLLSYFYVFFLVVITATDDLSRFYLGLKMPVLMIFSASFASILYERYGMVSHVQLYGWLLSIQLLLVLLSVSDEVIQEFIRSLNDPDDYKKISSYGRYRGVSWAYNSFFGLAVLLSWMMLFIAVSEIKRKARPIVYLFLFFSVLVFSLIARTVFLVFIFFFLFFIISRSSQKFLFIRKNTFWLLLVFSAFCWVVYFYDIKDIAMFQRSFEILINFMERGEVQTSSTNLLYDMYFSVSTHTMIFGDGKYVNQDGSYYMGTDSGYMRSILYWGLIGFIPSFISQVLLIFYIFKGYRERLIFLMFILILNIKGEVLSHHYALHFALFSLAFNSFISSRRGAK